MISESAKILERAGRNESTKQVERPEARGMSFALLATQSGELSARIKVINWLECHGYEATDDRVAKIREAAKACKKLLSDEH